MLDMLHHPQLTPAEPRSCGWCTRLKQTSINMRRSATLTVSVPRVKQEGFVSAVSPVCLHLEFDLDQDFTFQHVLQSFSE